jgi:hypothetical protein
MMDTQPLFILAVPRSYTSLIAAMLGQHPLMYGLPELNLFMAGNLKEFWTGKAPGDAKSPVTWPIMRHGLLRTIAELYSGEQTIDSIAMAMRWISHRSAMSTSEVYRLIAEKVSPLIPLDKSPGYINRAVYLKRLAETFPGARYIHLVRHPMGQCRSFLNLRGGKLLLLLRGNAEFADAGLVVDPQLAWYKGNKHIMEFLAKIPEDRQIRLVAEDLLTGLQPGLARICAWLGLPAGRDEIEAMKHPEDSPFAHVGPLNARLGNDINFLKNPELRTPVRIKRQTLKGPLPWRADRQPFLPEVVELARQFSYT